MLRLSRFNPLELVESHQKILHSLLKLCVGEPTISKLTKVLKLYQAYFCQLYFLEKAEEIIGFIGIK